MRRLRDAVRGMCPPDMPRPHGMIRGRERRFALEFCFFFRFHGLPLPHLIPDTPSFVTGACRRTARLLLLPQGGGGSAGDLAGQRLRLSVCFLLHVWGRTRPGLKKHMSSFAMRIRPLPIIIRDQGVWSCINTAEGATPPGATERGMNRVSFPGVFFPTAHGSQPRPCSCSI